MELLKKCNQMKGGKVIAVFLGSAAAVLLLLLIPFIARGSHLIWVAQAGDGAKQGVTFLNYLREVGWFGAIGSYDFHLGLGADFLASMTFFSLFDPFNVFVFILPFDVVWVYDIIMVLKFFAAGGAMLAYLRYRKVQGGYAVAFSLLYMLCGFIVFTFVRHLNLTSGAIYLPLMILGLEQVYHRKNPFVFLGFSFLCLINSFYMFFFNSVFVVLYAFLYHAEVCREGAKPYLKTLVPSLWRVAAVYLAAIFAAGFVLLPSAYGYLHAARGGSKGLDWFNLKNILLELVSLVAPTVGTNYSTVMLNLLSLVLAIAAFLFVSRKTFAYRVCTAVLAVGFFVPLFGYIMNIFNYSNNRWSYILSFCIFSMLAIQSSEWEGKAFTVPERRKIAKVLCVYLGLVALFGGAFGIKVCAESLLSSGAKGALIALLCLALLIVVGIVAWALSPKSFLADKKTEEGAEKAPKILDNRAARALAKPSVLSVLAVPLAAVLAFCYYIGYSAQHGGETVYRSLYSADEAYVAECNRTEFFRTDVQAADTWWGSFTNRSVNNGYMGTVLYNSMGAEPVYAFLTENQVYNPPRNLGMSGLDNRPALQSLLSVRYYYGQSGSYGFTKVDGREALYENEYYVPFGFVYEDTVSRAYYDSLDPLLRQYAMLSAMVVEDGGTLQSVPAGELSPLPASFSAGSGANFTLARGEEVEISLSGCAGKEVYIRLNDAAQVREKTEFRVTGNGKTRTVEFTEYGSNMYSADRDTCISLGVVQEDVLTVTLNLLKGREISFSSVEALGYDVADYTAAAEKLQGAAHLQNVEWGENFVSGNVSLDTPSWMFFSIPYDEGWSASVDGASAPLMRANAGFMAVELSAGEHEIVLEYETPWLKEGVILSLIGVAAAAGMAAVWLVCRARDKRKTPPENGVQSGGE